ncbi:MAG TPA: MmcQ/YjbR family DNA-binding protein, partial [Flavisolibacter sp.]|nr:MmcQ/YjbR family DNA-binding protein [Flavisolibacter sp.]
MPAVSEDIKWGNNLVFSVGNRMFFITSLEQPIKYSFKVKEDEFEELCATGNYSPAPYLARANWVLINSTATITTEEFKERVSQSYELVKNRLTKKEKSLLGIT